MKEIVAVAVLLRLYLMQSLLASLSLTVCIRMVPTM